MLKITDVVSENGEVESEDVIEDLNLQKIYFGKDSISPLDIEFYLLDCDDINEFSSKLRNSTHILKTIMEVGSILYKDNQFNDNSKMDLIRQVSGNYDLFKVNDLFKNVKRVNVKNDVLI